MGERLTIGYRCRIKPTSSWAEYGWANREIILKKRSEGRQFSALILCKGKNVKLERKGGIVRNSASWFNEEDLEVVDKEIDTNIRFLDWWEEASEYECPDCRHLCQEEYDADLDRDDDFGCPKCGCVFL